MLGKTTALTTGVQDTPTWLGSWLVSLRMLLDPTFGLCYVRWIYDRKVIKAFGYNNVRLNWLIATYLYIWSAISFYGERGSNQENSPT